MDQQQQKEKQKKYENEIDNQQQISQNENDENFLQFDFDENEQQDQQQESQQKNKKKQEKQVQLNEGQAKCVKKDDMYVIKKRYQKSLELLLKKEKRSLNEVVSTTPLLNLFIFHNGESQEEDYLVLKPFMDQFGPNKFNFIVAMPFCHVYYESMESIPKLLQNFQQIEEGYHTQIRFNENQKNQRNVFLFFTPLDETNIESIKEMNIPQAQEQIDTPGIHLIPDFITEEEEQHFINQTNNYEWIKLAKRRVQHFGYEFIYGENKINKYNKINPFPDYLSNVVSKMNKIMDGKQIPLDQLTINDYSPGDGIAPHFDVHDQFEEYIFLISLLSGIVMTFKRYNGKEQHLYISPRSLVVISGEGRYAWTHQIANRRCDLYKNVFFRQRRVSFTFRTVRFIPCKCQYPFFCPDQGYDPKTMRDFNPMLQKVLILEEQKQDLKSQPKTSTGKQVHARSEEEKQMMEAYKQALDKPSELEKKYVYEIYEKIAPHFSHTRYKPWPNVQKFLNQLPPGSLVADIGCGNGKYLGVNPDIFMIGTDRSENLLQICKDNDKNYQVFSADSLKLPWRSNSFDYAISIAVIHHFSTPALRITAIKEILRILKVNGEVLIYVWALEQDEKLFNEQDIFVPWNLQYKFEDKEVINNKEEQKQKEKDIVIDEQKQTVVYKRYYHIFKQNEIEELIMSSIKNIEIVDRFFDHANWVVRLKKTGENQGQQKQIIEQLQQISDSDKNSLQINNNQQQNENNK